MFDLSLHKPLPWFHYIDDTFMVWPYDPEQLPNFLSHLNSLRSSIQFAMEMESDSVIPLLDFLVIRKEMPVATKVYREPIDTG
jgi:hypothetical protein